MKIWKTKSGYDIIRILSGRSNAFLLINNHKSVLIDTGPSRNWNKLDRRLRRLKINNINCLILTHTHYDHSGNSYKLKDKYYALVMVHRYEVKYLTSGENGIIQGTNKFSRFLVNHFAPKISSRFKFQPCQPDILVEQYYDLTNLGFNAYLLHTPGHSDGSMSVIVDDEFAIVGDAMFGVFKGSIFPPFADNPVQMINSWGRLLDTNCKIFLPAHGSEKSREVLQKDYNKRKE